MFSAWRGNIPLRLIQVINSTFKPISHAVTFPFAVWLGDRNRVPALVLNSRAALKSPGIS